MSAARPATGIPPVALALAGALLLLIFAAAASMRIAGIPPSASPSLLRAEEHVGVVASRSLHFADRHDGAVVVTDAKTGAVATIIHAGEKTGFIRGVMRGLARERHQHGIGATPPFVLTAWRDGELSLVDTATGRAIELTAFGPTNRAAFAALLPAHAA